jgi:hypothetical protein
MEARKRVFAIVTFLAAFAFILDTNHLSDSRTFAQLPNNQSSVAISTVCIDGQACQTKVCSESQPCNTSKTPNIENPYEDYMDTREDMMDDFDDDFD